MARVAFIALLCAQLVSVPVLAQPSSAPTSVPASQPTILKLPEGTAVRAGSQLLRGYSLEDFKVLLRIYADYQIWGLQLPKLKFQVRDLTKIRNTIAKRSVLLWKEVQLLKKDRDRITKKWVEENRKRHLAENRPRFTSWIAWGSAVLFAIATTVLASILITKEG